MAKCVISLGLGVQSTWLYYASSMGLIERADVAIFADPGKEKKQTYEYLKNVLLPWALLNNGIEIIIANKKNLFVDLLNSENSTGNRFSSIPAFTKNKDGSMGMLRRQCTNEYKIEQIDNEIRKFYGIARGKRLPKIEVMQGITLDEISRMSNPQNAWATYVYTFCGFWFKRNDYGRLDNYYTMDRAGVLSQYEKYNILIPGKSSCVFCPFQSNRSWLTMKKENIEDFEAAVMVDEAIRNSTKKGIKNKVYLHHSGIPLKDVKFNNAQLDIEFGNCSISCNI